MVQVSGSFASIIVSSNVSPFDYGSRSNSSPVPYNQLPMYSTGPYLPSLAPHVTLPLVHGFAPNFPLTPTTATVPYSAGPLHKKRSLSPSIATSEFGSSQSSLGIDSQGSQDSGSANGAKNSAKWSDDQTLVLVQEWKDRVEEVESSRSVEAWNKIVAAVNKAGPKNTLKQC